MTSSILIIFVQCEQTHTHTHVLSSSHQTGAEIEVHLFYLPHCQFDDAQRKHNNNKCYMINFSTSQQRQRLSIWKVWQMGASGFEVLKKFYQPIYLLCFHLEWFENDEKIWMKKPFFRWLFLFFSIGWMIKLFCVADFIDEI